MQFRLGPPPENNNTILDSNWFPLEKKKQSPWKWQLKVMPVALASMASLAALWVLLTPIENFLALMSYPLPIPMVLSMLVGVLIIHEWIHVFTHPSAGFFRKSTIGFWPSKMFLYAFYKDKLSKNRTLLLLIAPYIFISYLPLIWAISTGKLNFWIFYISILNAFLSSGDLYLIFKVIKLPKNTVFLNKGNKFFWKHKS